MSNQLSNGLLMRRRRVPPTSAPVNVTPPAISGTATVGSTLTASTGTWLGVPAPTYAYQWKRDGGNIPGATASTYILDLFDGGTTVTVTVTATNIVGNASSTSSGVSVAAVAPTLAYGGNNYVTNSSSSFNVTLGNLGADGAYRRIHFAMRWLVSLGTPTVTIGGVVATQTGTRDLSTIRSGMFTAIVPTGTSVTANLNFGGNTNNVCFAWWVSRNLLSTAPTWFDSDANSNNLSTSLDVLANGVVIAWYNVGYGVSPGTVGWSGATSDFAANFGTQQRHAGASQVLTSANSSHAVSTSFNYPSGTLIAAAFR